ncbi:MAG: hypothetical protein WC716_07995 [Chitinophagaceae bacterium]|jgi:hypothetical protein
MDTDFSKLIQNVSKVKLQGGIFAKASIVLIIVSICIASIAALAGNIWVSCGAIGVIFILTFVILWRLINFANNNPQAAILEGAEFLVHEQIKLAAKGVGSFPSLTSNLTEETPIIIDEAIQNKANQPDLEIQNGKEANNG